MRQASTLLLTKRGVMEESVRSFITAMLFEFYMRLAGFCYGYHFEQLARYRAFVHLYGLPE